MESEEEGQEQSINKEQSINQEQSINITYETLFDILRMEKRREDVQQLQSSFFNDTVQYLKQKKELIRKKEHESGIDNFDEIKKLNIQYDNIQKIIKEIYERREKKILMMALNKSRTKMSAINVGVLLPQEMEFFDQVTKLLDTYRVDVFEKVIKGMLPKQQIAAVVNSLSAGVRAQQEQALIVENNANSPINSLMMQVKFLQQMEEFVGPELEAYGPFDANAVAYIPAMIAAVFITSGMAEEIK